MKRFTKIFPAVMLCLMGCAQSGSYTISEEVQLPEETAEVSIVQEEEREEEMHAEKLLVTVNDQSFEATFAENGAAEELKEILSEEVIVVSLSDYGGFEKVGSLGRSLASSNVQTTTEAGDIVLYNGNQIVLFYGSNSWSYTRLAKVDDLNGWEEALGAGDVTVELSLKEN